MWTTWLYFSAKLCKNSKSTLIIANLHQEYTIARKKYMLWLWERSLSLALYCYCWFWKSFQLRERFTRKLIQKKRNFKGKIKNFGNTSLVQVVIAAILYMSVPGINELNCPPISQLCMIWGMHIHPTTLFHTTLCVITGIEQENHVPSSTTYDLTHSNHANIELFMAPDKFCANMHPCTATNSFHSCWMNNLALDQEMNSMFTSYSPHLWA